MFFFRVGNLKLLNKNIRKRSNEKYYVRREIITVQARRKCWLTPYNLQILQICRISPITWFLYTNLTWGRMFEEIIPSCVVTKIIVAFPEESEQYVNFEGEDQDADGCSEIVNALEFTGCY